ncbi:RNA-induced silencing complex, nuclease component Tudor-SN [Cynara cardunculus var. scolymus]|uniref:Ribonuclease n=1 Tax=Cynara cardunculus var. scolymus TaxID=59895 RepID=A0A103XWC0_CYNCS|nr:RNA-induced silencing complex, nuclease component Tudor-SN [Cynara cardunculus var. scolymus]
MAQAAASSGWLRGRVKAAPSGDTLVIMGFTKAEIPPEKTIVLAHLSSPRLARRGGNDDPFAWESREFLRKLCIGKAKMVTNERKGEEIQSTEGSQGSNSLLTAKSYDPNKKDVVFKTEYTIPNFSREFCSLFVGTTNIAKEVVTHGWAKVKEAKGEVTPEHAELLRLEEQARQQGIGLWNRAPGASAAAIRNLPPSSVGDPSNLDAMGLLAANKGRPMEAIVEQVRDGSSLRVYLLPEFQFVQVFVAGIQAPSMGRRTMAEPTATTEVPSDEPNGETNGEIRGTLTSAQRVTASSAYNEVAPDPYGREAKHFTEIRVLNRDVRIVLEGVDKFSNLIGSVYYPDGEAAKDLALELIENWNGNIGISVGVLWLHYRLKKRIQAMTKHLMVPVAILLPASVQGFAKYVEWSAIMMEDEARRKLKAAELQAKKSKLRLWTNYVPPATNSKAISDSFTGEVVEVVSGDCIIVADDAVPFGSPAAERRVNLSSIRCPKLGNPRRDEKPAPYAREAREFLRTRLIGRQVQVSMEYSRKVPMADGSTAPTGPADTRVMGFGSVFLLSQGKDSEDVSPAPLPAGGQQPGVNVAELIIARGFGAVIRHRDFEERSNYYENLLAAESRATAGRKGIHSSKDPPVMHVMDLLTIEVETVDRTGTFLGSLWESKTNVAITLLEAGLARLQTSFGTDRIPDAHLLAQAEQFAKRQKLKIWENYVEGEQISNDPAHDRKQKEEFKVMVTEVLGGGKFYVQAVADQKVASIQKQLASLNLKEAPVLGSFSPKKGDIVLAQFTADNSWNRAMIVTAPRGGVQSAKDRFEVFYIDYGNQEVVAYNNLRPLDPSVSSAPGIAQLCSLVYLKVPTLDEDYGQEAAMLLSDTTLNGPKEFRAVIEEKDTSGGKVKGQGTGNVLLVTLIDDESGKSVNAMMLKKQEAMNELEKHQSEAHRQRLGMWEYGDIQSDDDENPPPIKKTGAGKR